MKTQTKTMHTPTPWRVQFFEDPINGNFVGEIHNDGVSICKSVNTHTHNREWIQESDANMEFIVRAVNSHEALLHACRRAFYLIKEGGFTHPMTEEFYDDTLHRIEKAIINAGGALTNPKDGE